MLLMSFIENSEKQRISISTCRRIGAIQAVQHLIRPCYAVNRFEVSRAAVAGILVSVLVGGQYFSGTDVTAINIWSTTCGPCIREMPELAEFADSLPDNLRIMTWCIDAEYSPDAGQISDFLSECGFTGVTLTSGDGDLSALLNELMYTPTTVFVDGAGNLLCEPVIGAGDIAENYTIAFNEGLKKLGKDPI